jgi:outer membrane protein assembly factor BamB
MLVTPKPGELAAAGDRFYFAADDGVVYAYKFEDEDPAWAFPVNVDGVGAPAIDDRCVYVAFLDNSVQAYQRGSGTRCWSTRTLKGRPAAGPLVAGAHLVIPLTTGELVVVGIKDGKTASPPDGAASSSQPAAATLQAIAASPDASSVYIVSVGGDQRRVLTARRKK